MQNSAEQLENRYYFSTLHLSSSRIHFCSVCQQFFSFIIRNFKSNRIVTSVFDLKRAQLFEIFEYLLSPISNLFNRMTLIFHLSNHAYQPTKSTNMELFVGPLWHTKVLKLLKQNPQQCGAIKTVEFI